MMNIQKLILVGGVAIAAALSSPAAQARDHHHHDRDDRDRHDYDRHHHHGDFDRHYYDSRRTVIYSDPYYDPTPGVTFAFGGSRHYRHWHHHR